MNIVVPFFQELKPGTGPVAKVGQTAVVRRALYVSGLALVNTRSIQLVAVSGLGNACRRCVAMQCRRCRARATYLETCEGSL